MAAHAATQGQNAVEHPVEGPGAELGPHLGLMAQIARAMHLESEAYEEVAADRRYGWKATLLVVAGGACAGVAGGVPGALAGIVGALVLWLIAATAISRIEHATWGHATRAAGLAFFPLVGTVVSVIAGDHAELIAVILGTGVFLTLVNLIVAGLHLARH